MLWNPRPSAQLVALTLVSLLTLSLGLWGALPVAYARDHAALPPTAPADILPTPQPLDGAPTDPAPVDAGAPVDDPWPPDPIIPDDADADPDADAGADAPIDDTWTPPVEPTPTPPRGARPDRCEPNDMPDRACTLPADGVSGPFTLVPADDADWYAIDLGAPNGLATTLTLRATDGLDLVVSLTRLDGAPLGLLDSATVSTTLAADVGGVIRLRVENRSLDDPVGALYGLELRRVLPPATMDERRALRPDRLENNYDFTHAMPVGINVVYDLNFVCPDGARPTCIDHDFVRLPVKAGLTYLFATTDLAPGVDTQLDLYWGDETTPIVSNDDATATSFLSVLRWRAPGHGDAVLRIGPRTGALDPLVFTDTVKTYRLALAVQGSPFATALEDTLAAQTGQPIPSEVRAAQAAARAATATAQAIGPTPMPAASVPTVTAIITANQAPLMLEPRAGSLILTTLPVETVVELLGDMQGTWVKVVSDAAVVPGWIDSRLLRRLATPALPPATSPITPTDTFTPPLDADPGLPPDAAPPLGDAITPPTYQVTPRGPPAKRDAPPVTPTLATRVITVTVRDAALQGDAPDRPYAPTPTPHPDAGQHGVRVQLWIATGALLTEAVTDAMGAVVFRQALPPDAALIVALPLPGLSVPLDPTQTTVIVAIPRADPAAEARP